MQEAYGPDDIAKLVARNARLSDECREIKAENERLRATLHDLRFAFENTSEIPETPFTLHALGAIRRVLGIDEQEEQRGR